MHKGLVGGMAVAVGLGLGTALASPAEQAPFDAPEAAVWHAGSQSWFVSNLGGGVTLEKNGKGFIARLDRQAAPVAPRWVAGLDAPTGMAIVGDRLWVGDRGVLVEIDIAAGRIVERHPVSGAEFVNDVEAAPDGTLYISDFTGNRLYRKRPGGAVEVWVEEPELDFPNGMVVDGDRLVVATWGPMTNPETFETSRPGTLLTVDLASGAIRPLADGRPIANFDGIEKVGDHFLATDWMGGRLLKIERDGTVTELLTGFTMLADLGVDPESGDILLPEMGTDRVIRVNRQGIAGLGR